MNLPHVLPGFKRRCRRHRRVHARQVGARTEMSACPGQGDGARFGIDHQCVQERRQFAAHFRTKCIALFRLAQRDDCDRPMAIQFDHFAHEAALSPESTDCSAPPAPAEPDRPSLRTRKAFSLRNFGQTFGANGTFGNSEKLRSKDRPEG